MRAKLLARDSCVAGILIALCLIAESHQGLATTRWNACALRLESGRTRSSATFIRDRASGQYYVITAYHGVYNNDGVTVRLATPGTRKSLLELCPADSFFFFDPALDLAVFKLSASGAMYMRNKLLRTAFVLDSECPKGEVVRVVGNPTIDVPAGSVVFTNAVTNAGVADCKDADMIVGRELLDGDSAYGTQMLLMTNLLVTHGFSGGPVVSGGVDWNADSLKVAGIVQGGNEKWLSWAVSAEGIIPSIKSAVDAGRFTSFPPTPGWARPVFKERSYGALEGYSWKVKDVSPRTRKGGARAVVLRPGRSTSLRVVSAIQGPYRKAVAYIDSTNWLQVVKTADPQDIAEKDIVTFEWKVKPLENPSDQETLRIYLAGPEVDVTPAERDPLGALELPVVFEYPRFSVTLGPAGFGSDGDDTFFIGSVTGGVRLWARTHLIAEAGTIRWRLEKAYALPGGEGSTAIEHHVWFGELQLRQWWTVFEGLGAFVGAGGGFAWEDKTKPVFSVEGGLASGHLWGAHAFLSVAYRHFNVREQRIEFDYFGKADVTPVDNAINAITAGVGVSYNL